MWLSTVICCLIGCPVDHGYSGETRPRTSDPWYDSTVHSFSSSQQRRPGIHSRYALLSCEMVTSGMYTQVNGIGTLDRSARDGLQAVPDSEGTVAE